MALCIGKMGMRPADFWAMSWPEFVAATGGFAEFHGGGSKGTAPPSKEEAADLIEMADAQLKKQGLYRG